MKMGPIDCPETSVRNYHFRLHNITDEHRSQNFSCSSCSWTRVNNKKASRWRKRDPDFEPLQNQVRRKTDRRRWQGWPAEKEERNSWQKLYKPQKTKRHYASQTRLQSSAQVDPKVDRPKETECLICGESFNEDWIRCNFVLTWIMSTAQTQNETLFFI